MVDGRVIQGYKQGETKDDLTLRDPASGDAVRIAEGRHRGRAPAAAR